MSKTIVIYHGNCFDGMASAWAAWKKFGEEATYIPAFYDQPFPPIDASDSEVYILDFSYPRERLLFIKSQVKKLVVLDHHKTAQKDLEGLDFCIFDMEKSGARLSWEYFHGMTLNAGTPANIPNLIRYIEDRDLWRFALDGTHYINAYIQSFPMSIESYTALDRDLRTTTGLNSACIQGESIERYKDTMVDAMCKSAAVREIGGYLVPVANSTILFSEVGNKLCINYPNSKFAAYFTARGDGKFQYGLRSIGDFDVSEVAKKYGGGGHKNASGFISNKII